MSLNRDVLYGVLIVIVFIIIIATLCIHCPVKPLEAMTPITSLPEGWPSHPKRVCIFMVVTPEIMEYAQHSIDINRDYCKRWGYDFKVVTQNTTPDLPINFAKIQSALDFAEGVPEYIVHIDADAIIIKKDYPITNIIHKYFGSNKLTSFIAAEDCYSKDICSQPGRINSGVFIVKNNYFGRLILKKWLSSARKGGACHKYKDVFPNCQLVFYHCILKSFLRPFIKIVPYNVLNGKDGLFIQHLMQHTDDKRSNTFKEFRYQNDDKFINGETRMKVF